MQRLDGRQHALNLTEFEGGTLGEGHTFFGRSFFEGLLTWLFTAVCKRLAVLVTALHAFDPHANSALSRHGLAGRLTSVAKRLVVSQFIRVAVSVG